MMDKSIKTEWKEQLSPSISFDVIFRLLHITSWKEQSIDWIFLSLKTEINACLTIFVFGCIQTNTFGQAK